MNTHTEFTSNTLRCMEHVNNDLLNNLRKKNDIADELKDLNILVNLIRLFKKELNANEKENWNPLLVSLKSKIRNGEICPGTIDETIGFLDKNWDDKNWGDKNSQSILSFLKERIENLQNEFEILKFNQLNIYAEIKRLNELIVKSYEDIELNYSFECAMLFNQALSYFDKRSHELNYTNIANEAMFEADILERFDEIRTNLGTGRFAPTKIIDLKKEKVYTIQEEDPTISTKPLTLGYKKYLDLKSTDRIYDTLRQMHKCFKDLKICEFEPLADAMRFDPEFVEDFTEEIIHYQNTVVEKYLKIKNLVSTLLQYNIDRIDWPDRLLAILDQRFSDHRSIFPKDYEEAFDTIYYGERKLDKWGKLVVSIFYQHEVEFEVDYYINNLINTSKPDPKQSVYGWAMSLCYKAAEFKSPEMHTQLFFKIEEEIEKRGISLGLCAAFYKYNNIYDFYKFLSDTLLESMKIDDKYPGDIFESELKVILDKFESEGDLSRSRIAYFTFTKMKTEAEYMKTYNNFY
ncbi:hypothetical protein B5S31_g5209 [[Candida] boidinii]|nr:hypothetical protein B5S31_g5209 [[Candida] boidinii]OWB78957.1 hypothetical protein B5S32_g3163 [[Candida] boidinii]